MERLTISKLRKRNFLIQPVGLNTDKFGELWLQMEFQFSGEKSDVVVEKFWITTASGAAVNLSELTYSQVQSVCEFMAEEFQFHTAIYYDALESDYYENIKDAKHEREFDQYRDSRGA